VVIAPSHALDHQRSGRFVGLHRRGRGRRVGRQHNL